MEGGVGGEEEILMVVEVDGRLDEEEVVQGSRIWKRKLEVVIRDRDIFDDLRDRVEKRKEELKGRIKRIKWTIDFATSELVRFGRIG